MHPIVAQMSPNAEQRPAVLERGRDVVVTAGAGTGKTRTLVARYLSLLADGFPLRAIVAITFTQKAAREMRNRIRAEIRRYLDRPDLAAQERWIWDGHYNLLDAARIGTIHNLCTEILHAHPAEAGVDPRFEVLDEGQAGILLSESVDAALAWAADDAQAVRLFELLGEWSLGRLLTDLLRQRLDVQAIFEQLPEDPWPLWQERLARPLGEFVDDGLVRDAFTELSALQADGTLARAMALGDKLAEPLAAVLELWQRVQVARAAEDWASVAQRLLLLRQNLKQVGSQKAWQPANPKAAIGELQGLYDDRLAGWLGKSTTNSGVNLDLDRRWAAAMPALRQIFGQALQAYDTRKAERQALDFDDLEAGALTLLHDFPAVRRRWQTEIKAVLVDEYQDTNGRQRDLVNLINGDDHKLFIVGDAKQSIYRFRGADVTVFRSERTRIESAGGAGWTLAESYRAHRPLLEGLNQLLQPILGTTEDPDRPWREPFAALQPYWQEARSGLPGPYIELHLTVGSKGDGALDRAAEALVGRLSDLLTQAGDRLNYGDVAILCRSSNSFGAYEDALDSAGLPYLTVAGRGFYERPEIRDLLNALQALADPTDDLALVGLLRSPVIGFSDAELYALAREWRQSDQDRPLWHILRGKQEAKTRRAVKIVDELNGQSGRMPVAALLKAFLDTIDYRAALLQAGFGRAARNVSKLLADAHASGIVGVGEFLDYIGNLRAGIAREGEARATAGNVVRIMSVHAAKGLEFSVVVIGDISYDRPGGGGTLLDSQLGIFPDLRDEDGARTGLYTLLQVREKDQEEAESDRLLYVAATRAQEVLLLNGAIKLSGSGRPGWLRGWLKKLDQPLALSSREVTYDDEGHRAIALELRAGSTPVACAIYEPGYSPPPATTSPAAVSQPEDEWSSLLVAPVEAGRQELDETLRAREQEPGQRVWRIVPARRRPHAPAWVVGALVHEALAAWRFPDETFAEWVGARARGHGLAGSDLLRDAAYQTATLLRRFQAHPLFREMDGAQRRLHEVPYSLLAADGQVIGGIIDALYLHEGRWTLVEFKSDHIGDEAAFKRVMAEKDYRSQVEGYMAAFEQLLGQQPRAILCLLNYTQTVRLETVHGRDLAGASPLPKPPA